MAISMPFIYAMVIPIAVLDIATQIYQRICFPLYAIERVDRSRYIRCSTRGKSLPWIDRFNCWYCAYANGAVEFIRAVLTETEKYWCPIRHVPKSGFQEPAHRGDFAPEGNLPLLERILKAYPYKK